MDVIIDNLPRVGACITLIIGLVGFFKPTLLTNSLDIKLDSAVAMSEARAVFGGLNLGGGIAALLFNDPLVYMSLGIAWSLMTLSRFYSMIADKSTLKESIPPLIVDGGLAFLFLSGLIWQ